MIRQQKAARWGVFGGTFNPIHLGHLRAAEEVAEALELEQVVFLPSAVPPHKDRADDAIAPAHERLRWVQLAVAGNPRFAVDPLELERGGTSYSVDTLRSLRQRRGETPVFVIGLDAFAEIDTWRDPASLFALAHFAVMTRPPLLQASLTSCLPRCLVGQVDLAADGRSGRHRELETWIRLVEITALEISATDIRTRLRRGRSVRYLLPEAVREAILGSGTYTPREAC